MNKFDTLFNAVINENQVVYPGRDTASMKWYEHVLAPGLVHHAIAGQDENGKDVVVWTDQDNDGDRYYDLEFYKLYKDENKSIEITEDEYNHLVRILRGE